MSARPRVASNTLHANSHHRRRRLRRVEPRADVEARPRRTCRSAPSTTSSGAAASSRSTRLRDARRRVRPRRRPRRPTTWPTPARSICCSSAPPSRPCTPATTAARPTSSRPTSSARSTASKPRAAARADVIFLSTSRVYPIARPARAAARASRRPPRPAGRRVRDRMVVRGASRRTSRCRAPARCTARPSSPRSCSSRSTARCTACARSSIAAASFPARGRWARSIRASSCSGRRVTSSAAALSYIGFGGEGLQVRDVLHIDDLYDLIRRQIADFAQLRRRRVQRRRRRGRQRLARRADGAVPRAHRPQRCPSPAIARDERRRRAVLRHRQLGQSPRATGWAPRRAVGALLDDVFAWLREHRTTLEPMLRPRRRDRTPPVDAPESCLSSSSPAPPASSASEAAAFFAGKGFDVVGDRQRHAALLLRRRRQHRLAARRGSSATLQRLPPRRRRHPRRGGDRAVCSRATARTIALVIHTAAQPSHDWAAREPHHRLHRQRQRHADRCSRRRGGTAPTRAFIFTATNKVYGDTPNRLPLVERETRWAVDAGAPVRRARHRRDDVDRPDDAQPVRRLEGRGRRAGAGVRPLLRHEDGVLPRRLPDRARPLRRRAARLPRRISVKCARHRPALHGLRLQGQAGPRQHPLATTWCNAFWHFFQAPRSGEVYNIGGGRGSQLLDARGDRARRAADRPADAVDLQRHEPRRRSHLVGQRHPASSPAHYPDWALTYSLERTIEEIHDEMTERAAASRDR